MIFSFLEKNEIFRIFDSLAPFCLYLERYCSYQELSFSHNFFFQDSLTRGTVCRRGSYFRVLFIHICVQNPKISARLAHCTDVKNTQNHFFSENRGFFLLCTLHINCLNQKKTPILPVWKQKKPSIFKNWGVCLRCSVYCPQPMFKNYKKIKKKVKKKSGRKKKYFPTFLPPKNWESTLDYGAERKKWKYFYVVTGPNLNFSEAKK